jgi:GntR family transcriptional regulator
MSAIAFRLDPASGVPTYLQLVQQVEHALRLGYLELGDRLPRIKDVVGSLAINPNTVVKAYRELEHRGLVGTLGDVPLADQQALRRTALRWISAARDAGLDDEGIAALFFSALSEARDAREGVATS